MHKKFPAAAHIFFIRDNTVLLSRRFNTGYEDGNYSVVAGHLNGDETVTQAAIREAKEEVGVSIKPENISVVGVMLRKSNDERVDFFLVNKTWSGEMLNMEPEKCDGIAWFPINSLPGNTIPYIRQALNNYLKQIWFEEYGW